MTTTQAEFEVRRGDDRGTTMRGWLHARHSFSFGHYQDPARMSYRALRVLNEDVFGPGGGFPEHPHENMEIVTWILAGALEHADSTGERGVIRPGDLQVMTAGHGIRHSEMNASQSEPVHLVQIWIEPAETGLEPAYGQMSFPVEGRRNRWQVLASPDARDGSHRIHQDAMLSLVELDPGKQVTAAVGVDRHAYLHVATGELRAGETTLDAGDAMTWSGPGAVELDAIRKAEVLLFDMG